jgi:hypothetical protein
LRDTLLHPALADENVGKSVLSPWVSRGDPEGSFRTRLGLFVLTAELAGEGRHGEKIRIVGVRRFQTLHVRAEPRAHILLADHVVEELRQLGGEEIARPLGGDRLQGFYGVQVVIAVPKRERPMQCALPPVRRERFART